MSRHAGLSRFERDLEVALQDRRCAELRQTGMSHSAIGREVGMSEAGVRNAIKRALKAVVQEAGEDLRQLELARLDDLWEKTTKVLLADHPKVADGRVVVDKQGVVINDPMVKLHAVDRLLKIQDRRAKLVGLDAPVRTELRVQDGLDAQLEILARDIGLLASADVEGSVVGVEEEAPLEIEGGTS